MWAMVTFIACLLLDPNNREEMKKAEIFGQRLVERAQSKGGTCTGEHGVGSGKGKYLLAEVGQTGLNFMAQIKQAFDPENLFNPNKLGNF